MKNLSYFLTLILISSACAQNPYDRSTPEKFVVAMGQAAVTFDEYYPIPYFYTKDAADAIQKYDELGMRGQKAYDEFKATSMGKFPQYASPGFSNKLKFTTSDGSTRTFSFSVSIIGDQIKNRKPEDYTFVSSETTEDGLVNITMTIEGREVTIPTKKIDGQLKMFMDEKNMDNMKNMTEFLEGTSAYYEDWTAEMKSGKVTEENLFDKVNEWDLKYMGLIKKMNGQ